MADEAPIVKAIEKMLDLIKSSGWQTAAGAAAFGALWWMERNALLPPFEPKWITHIVALGFLLCGFLTIAAIVSAVLSLVPLRRWLESYWSTRALKKRVEKEIPFHTKRERFIIGYLLHHNCRTIEGDQDGGYAAPLLSHGFIKVFARHGQLLDMTRVPMIVPEPVWEVWQLNKDKFPYEPIYDEGHEIEPWHIPWMVR